MSPDIKPMTMKPLRLRNSLRSQLLQLRRIKRFRRPLANPLNDIGPSPIEIRRTSRKENGVGKTGIFLELTTVY